MGVGVPGQNQRSSCVQWVLGALTRSLSDGVGAVLKRLESGERRGEVSTEQRWLCLEDHLLPIMKWPEFPGGQRGGIKNDQLYGRQRKRENGELKNKNTRRPMPKLRLFDRWARLAVEDYLDVGDPRLY